MSHPNPSTAMARVIVDELTRHGVRFAVMAPGSRSSALVIALVEHGEIELVVHLDERSAAFRALGRSLVTGSPSLVVTTSGSAVANLMPAVVEADASAVPLIMMTADRPADLVARRANQTMVQPGIFGEFVRATVALEAPDGSDANSLWRRSVSAAVGSALGEHDLPGPVHLNVAFREPTVPVSGDGRVSSAKYDHATDGSGGGEPWVAPWVAEPPDPSWATDLGTRPVVIAGRGSYDVAGLKAVAAVREIPLLATALSMGRESQGFYLYHHILVAGVPEPLQPTGVVVVGQSGPSSRLHALAEEVGVPVVHIDRWGRHSDPSGTMSQGMRADPVEALRQWNGISDGSLVATWQSYQDAMGAAMGPILESHVPTGPGVAHSLNDVAWDSLVVGSSLPVRDVDAFLRRPGPVRANRGLSGIDGFVSTALGVARGDIGTVAMVGDLSFLHDANGFLSDVLHPVVFVVVDNNGGGLFDLLPQSVHAPEFERLFVTPHDRDLGDLAAFYDLHYERVRSLEGLKGAIESAMTVGAPSLVHVPVSREDDIAIRAGLDDVARRVLSDLD